MKNIFKKRIVDERMELQSLRNARKSWNFLLLATGFSLLAEIYLLRWELKYMAPQAVILFAASIYNLFLDARDGNIYTAEAADRRKIFLLYAVCDFIAALLIGINFYSRFSLVTGVMVFLIAFLLMLGLTYLLDSFCFRIGKKRAMGNSEDEE